MKKFINKILEKPVLSIIFLFIFSYVFTLLVALVLTVPFFFLTTDYQVYTIICYLLQVVVSISVLLLFDRWFKNNYEGSFKGDIIKGLLYALPLLIVVFYNIYLATINEAGMSDCFLALAMALAPGVTEEVVFRALIIPNYLRIKQDAKAIVTIVTITALMFGLIHLLNIFSGANVGLTLIQVLYTFGFGALLAAVYIRCGSIIPPMIAHTLIDFSAFLNKDVLENGGIQQAQASLQDVVVLGTLALITIVCAYYLIRKEKRDTIIEIWKDKWSKNV